MYTKHLEQYPEQSQCWALLAIFLSMIYGTEKEELNA